MATLTKSLSSKVSKSNGKSEVLLRFVGGRGLVFRAKSGLYIDPSKWSAKTQRGKQSAIDQEIVQFNVQLAELERAIASSFEEAKNERTISPKWLQEVVDLFHDPQAAAEPSDFLGYVKTFVETSDKRQINGKLLALGTRKHYKCAYNHLCNYVAARGLNSFGFADINEGFYNDFVLYLQGLNQSTNRIGSLVKIVKTFVHAAPKEWQNLTDMQKFRVLREQATNIYLSEAELNALEAYDFAGRECFDRVRDAFLLLAWTGCRYSDLGKVSPDNCKNGMLQLRQQKTGALVTIPLHPAVKRIFDKYDGNLPKPISEQKFNAYIKEVCKCVGFDGIEKKTRTKGGVVTTKELTKADMVSSHTGRRSFATNMYLRGIPTLTIMAITGHTTETSFLAYIKVTKEEHAKRMADMWKQFYN